MYDSVFVLVEAFNRIIRKKPDQFRAYTMRRQNGQTNVTATTSAAKFLDCNTSKGWVTQWEHGERIAKNLRKVEIEGLTGDIRFNEEGHRINYTLHIVEMTGERGIEMKSLRILNLLEFFFFLTHSLVNSAMVKVAEWTDVSGIMAVAAKYVRNKNHDIEKNKTYIVTTLLDEPYMMLKKLDMSGKVLEGNDKYEGYCKDLAELITKRLEINCKTLIMTLKEGEGEECERNLIICQALPFPFPLLSSSHLSQGCWMSKAQLVIEYSIYFISLPFYEKNKIAVIIK